MKRRKTKRTYDPLGLKKSGKTIMGTAGLVVTAATAKVVTGTAKGLY